MNLDERKKKILATVVENYIESAEPVASKTIAEKYEREFSSATIRNEMKQLEDIANAHKGVDKSFAIQAGREVRIMVVPEMVSDDDMILLARNISKQIEEELEYPGQIKVNVIRESRVTDFAK